MTQPSSSAPAHRPPLPSITASALLESRLLVRAVAAWFAGA